MHPVDLGDFGRCGDIAPGALEQVCQVRALEVAIGDGPDVAARVGVQKALT